MGGFPNLKALLLRENNLVGALPPEMGNLVNLEELDLSENAGLTGGIPPEWGKMSSLETLNLGYTGLTGCIPTAVQVRLGSGARPFGSEARDDDPFCAAGSVQTVQVTQPGTTTVVSDDRVALVALYNPLAAAVGRTRRTG